MTEKYPRYKGILEITTDALALLLRLKPGIEIYGVKQSFDWFTQPQGRDRDSVFIKVRSFQSDVGLPFVPEAEMIPQVSVEAVQVPAL
jgi:hypothetical protein